MAHVGLIFFFLFIRFPQREMWIVEQRLPLGSWLDGY